MRAGTATESFSHVRAMSVYARPTRSLQQGTQWSVCHERSVAGEAVAATDTEAVQPRINRYPGRPRGAADEKAEVQI